jgi:hypothetical protein
MQKAPVVDRVEVQQWIEDALSEALAHSEREDVEESLSAWKSGYSHFEVQLEPALRYYEADSNKVAELEFLIGRIGAAAGAGDPVAMAKNITVFDEKLDALLPIIPLQSTPALTH